MKMIRIKTLGIALSAVLLASVGATPVLAQRISPPAQPCKGTWWVEQTELALGEKMPDFGFDSCQEQNRTISDFEGQPVLVNFWATWCPPCIKELPHFSDLAKDDDYSVKVLGVSLDRDPATLHSFLDQHPLGYEVTWDGGGIATDLGITSIPVTIAIDSAGNVVYVHKGYIAEDQLDQLATDLDSKDE